MLDLRQTSEYKNYMESTGWKVEKLGTAFAYIKKILIFGNAIKIQRPYRFDYHNIDKLVEKYRPFQIFVEPSDEAFAEVLRERGFKLSKTYFLPTKTVQIDLKKTESQLLTEMHYKTRYNIKKADINKIKLKKSEDINTFADFWQKCALQQRGMYLSLKRQIVEIYKAFSNKSDLLFALHSNELIGSLLIIHSDKISYYMYAASSELGKKLFAPTILAWKAILLSKKRGSKIFDFEGIYDERFPLKSWLGFTRFKKSFGGKEIEYPGTYEKFLLPFKI